MQNINTVECTVPAEKIKELEICATKIRLNALKCVYNAKSGHPGGSLSIAEILSYLYFYKMNINPENPQFPLRDRFVLSKGHCSPALYSALALRGYFPESELVNFRRIGSFLQGHPDMKHTPGVDMSTGSLGQGISAACGMAYVSKNENKHYSVYTVVGDGEIQEGQVWEAAMFAGAKRLDNLCVFVDFNNLQISGRVTDVLSPCPITDKFESFGFNTCEIDGHSISELDRAVTLFEHSDKPFAIICKTIKGKGVSFMEDNAAWHGSAPSTEQYNVAVSELSALLAKQTAAK